MASTVNVSGNIGSLLSFYKHEKRIFGCCPSCGEPFRLSDVKLTYGKEPPRDLISKLQATRERLKADLEELETKLEELKEQHREHVEGLEQEHSDAIAGLEGDYETELQSMEETWRAKVDVEVDKQLIKTKRQIRQDAIAKSRSSQLGKTLEKVAPLFTRFGHHPYDVRPMFDPIDFVVFDGYFEQEVTDITFVEFKTAGQKRLSRIQSSIREAVERKRVHFEIQRLSSEAIRLITSGKRAELERVE